MSSAILIADSGATKAEWCLVNNGKKRTIFTQGISPYFMNTQQIADLLQKELKPKLKNVDIGEIYYYGTGCFNPDNARLVRRPLKKLLPDQKWM